MKSQKKIGMGISYINIVLSMLSHIVIVPMLISHLSDDGYSIYRVMQTFAGPLIMFNMGLSTVAARSIARFNALGEESSKEKENTLALTVIITTIMATLVVLVGLVMMGTIDNLFAKSIKGENIVVAKQVFILFIFSTAVHILNDVMKGCLQGNEKFAFFYGMTTAQHIMRFTFMVVMMQMGLGVVAITSVDLIIGVILLISSFSYVKFGLKERFRLYKLDKAEIVAIFTFSLSILLQAIINQVNNNLDILILGAIGTQAAIITMYSSALAIVSTYNSILSALVSMFLPKATVLVTKDTSGEELTDFVIRGGRLQVALAFAVLGGFTVLGQNFISLWIGSKYSEAYYVILTLMIPVTIPLVQNVCLSILDAKLKRMFRSVVLVLMAVANVGISLVLVNYLGYWGAAIGTAVSMIVGHGFVMNIYYQKVIGLNVKRMFFEMFKGFLPALLLTLICCIPLWFLGDSPVWFVIKGILFVAVYFVWVWLLGLNKEEKQYFGNMFSNKLKKNR